jgi:Proteobacterial lipase chaperone protein
MKVKTLAWTGALGIAAVLIAMLMPEADDAEQRRDAAEPNLFPFVRALDSLPNAEIIPAAAAPAASGQAGAATLAASAADRMAPAHVADIETKVRQLRALGASDDEVYRLRAAALSAQAANELARIDRDEAVWQQRVAAYLEQRNRLAVQGGAASFDVLAQLRDAHFTPEEHARLAASEPSLFPQLTPP